MTFKAASARRGWLVSIGALIAVLACIPSRADARAENVPDLQAFMSEYAASQGGAAPLFAIRPPNVFTHNVGLLQLQITNIGMIGNFFINNFAAGWRGGEYLYAAGLWVGAKRGDGIPHVTTAVYELEFLPPPDPEWTVYEAFEGIQGGNRLGFSSGPQDEVAPGSGVGDILTSGANDDWNGGADGQIDEDFLNGLDDDGDGQVDEDFEAIAQQMFSCQYWDISEFTQEAEPDHVPLDLLVRQRSFAWATAGTNEFVGFDFEVFNIGNETLNDVFIAFFVDGDAGPKDRQNYWVDDKFGYIANDTTIVNDSAPPGCQTTVVDYSIAYIFDTPDIEINEESGGVRGGDVPGYFGGMFLGHTTDPLGVEAPPQVGIRTARSFSGSEPFPEGDPRNDAERYELISSAGTPTRPETIKEADYRYVIAAGPFRTLPPDTSITFQTAFVIGEGRSGMVENAVQAQLIYDGVWRDADGNEQTGSGGKETCIRPPGNATSANWDNPCDSLSTSIPIQWPGYCAPENYVDNDCNSCTPLATDSDPGPETLVNWVGTVAPPPPATNTECEDVEFGISPEGDKRVVLQWDNLSELKADPIQRRILFEGYRIWRVEGWRRPVGSTGPAPEDWQLLAQIVKNPVDPAQRCFVTDPRTGESVALEFNVRSHLGNWEPEDPSGILPDDPCEACPQFCWPQRLFRVNELLAPIETGIATGDTTPGMQFADLYPVGYYTYVDTAGIKNGMVYFYDVTAFSAWEQITYDNSTNPPTEIIRNFELSGRPAARECQMVVPTWPARDTKNEIYVVPNPYVQGDRTVLPWGWDLIPSDQDPTGTRLAFTNLPEGRNIIKIYTLAGDLVETLDVRATGENGTAFWNLVSRNGQDVVAGIYLFTVVTESQGTKVGRFVVIR